MPKSFPITSREQWLALRKEDVTSTQVAALFGEHPRLTELSLWQEKKECIEPVFNEAQQARMRWGLRMEPIIAYGLSEDNHLKIQKMDVYMRHDEVNFGASFDYEIIDQVAGNGILEIKYVSEWGAKRWQTIGDVLYPPSDFELQLQAQMEVSGRSWGMLGVLFSSGKTALIRRERDKDMGAGMVNAVRKFWANVNQNIEPEPRFPQDANLIQRLRAQAEKDKILDARDNMAVGDLMMEYDVLTREIAHREHRQRDIKAQMYHIAGDASKVIVSDRQWVQMSSVKGSAGKMIGPEDIGKIINKRNGYRMFRVFGHDVSLNEEDV